jgi:hypothetical protein
MWTRNFKSFFRILPLLLLAGCAAQPPGLQEYDVKKVYSYLCQHGFKGDGIHYFWQDSQGRALYFAEGDLEDHVKGHAVFILRKDRDEPLRMTIPPATYVEYWIDPEGQIRFLPPYLPPVETQVTENIYTNEDLQSPYFTEETRDNNVHVGSFKRTDGWLFSTPKPYHEAWLMEVTGRDDVIYLEDNRDADSPAFLHSGTNCWAFAKDPKDPTKYVKVNEFSVAGLIVALDPFSPRCICREYGIDPFHYSHFLFDTQKHKKLASLPDNVLCAFLDGDWLGPRLTRVKHPNTEPTN